MNAHADQAVLHLRWHFRAWLKCVTFPLCFGAPEIISRSLSAKFCDIRLKCTAFGNSESDWKTVKAQTLLTTMPRLPSIGMSNRLQTI